METKEENDNNQRPVAFQEEYVEEEDEDFDPSKVQEVSEEEDEDDFKPEQKTSGSHVDYSRIESDSGGLVRTRKARYLEEERLKRHKYESVEVKSISEESSKIWEELRQEGLHRLKGGEGKKSVIHNNARVGNNYDSDPADRKILIKRSYKFAGEIVHEEKMVDISSAEAKEYLSSTKFQERDNNSANKNSLSNKMGVSNENGNAINLRRPLKRPPLLEQIISGALKPKLTTLEKSSLDWASYVDKEGINEELALHNKDGYLAKQDFLNRVESFKDQQYKELRQKQLTMHLQNGS